MALRAATCNGHGRLHRMMRKAASATGWAAPKQVFGREWNGGGDVAAATLRGMGLMGQQQDGREQAGDSPWCDLLGWAGPTHACTHFPRKQTATGRHVIIDGVPQGVNRPLTGGYGGGAGGGYGEAAPMKPQPSFGYAAPAAMAAPSVVGSEEQLVNSICTPGGGWRAWGMPHTNTRVRTRAHKQLSCTRHTVLPRGVVAPPGHRAHRA